MPVLKDFRRTKIIKLSKFEGSEIEIYDSILAKDARFDYDVNNVEQNIGLLCKFIKDWNFTNEDGKKISISGDSIGLLDVESITELANEIKKFAIEVKKN